MTVPFAVCVPARDEAERIGVLIAALGEQSAGPVLVALCVNNSDDGTAAIARRAAASTMGRVDLRTLDCCFAPPDAHAGSARRAAMDLGADLLSDSAALLISTDADCRPPRDWIAANLASAGPDRIVGGRIELDEDETVAPAVRGLKARFDRYWQAVREIEDAIDPTPWDPGPRHGDHTGASLTLDVALYRRAGGVPAIPVGEDRALVEAAVNAGGRLVHPPAVWTRASARTAGRAEGGMSGDVRRWLEAAEQGVPPHVPAFGHWRARAAWRRRRRDEGRGAEIGRDERSLPPMPCDMPLPGI